MDLYDQHAAMVPVIARSVAARLPPSFDAEDLAQIGRMALFLACEAYDPARGITFSLYLRERVRGAMLDAVRGAPYREATHARLPDLPSAPAGICQRDPFLRRAIDELPSRQQNILDLRFGDGLSQIETAARLGISRSAAIREERAALAAIRRKLRIAA